MAIKNIKCDCCEIPYHASTRFKYSRAGITNLRRLLKRIALFIGCFNLSTFALATGDGFYMGTQVGYANLNNVAETVNTGQTVADPNAICNPNLPFNTTPDSCRTVNNVKPTNTGIAARVFMGANVKTYFGFEFGVAAYTPSEYDPEVSGFTHQPHIWEYSADILGKIMYPFGPFGIFAKGGLGIVYKSASAAIINTEGEEESGGNISIAPAYGIGVSYDITPNWVVDLSILKIQGNSDIENIDFTGIGISYHFVDEYCGQFLC